MNQELIESDAKSHIRSTLSTLPSLLYLYFCRQCAVLDATLSFSHVLL